MNQQMKIWKKIIWEIAIEIQMNQMLFSARNLLLKWTTWYRLNHGLIQQANFDPIKNNHSKKQRIRKKDIEPRSSTTVEEQHNQTI